ncbi:MAG TPA: PadR family transcriptional regulator [Candidatus Sulfotelmatobacter sp.]|nr:PadR family transcriptional regulator [Candidatus Sulfotelmatobacter sp.]
MNHFFHEHGHIHGRGRHRRGVFGPGFPFDVRFERGFEKGFGGRWKARTRRGDMKFLVLETIAEQPRHGYEIIRAIEEKRGFRPSAGSIYPTLQFLEDGGFVSGAEVDGKRVYTITDAGRAMLADRANEREDDEDAIDEDDDARHRLKHAAIKLAGAVMSARGADESTLEKVRTILDRARKEIYGLLAEDEA